MPRDEVTRQNDEHGEAEQRQEELPSALGPTQGPSGGDRSRYQKARVDHAECRLQPRAILEQLGDFGRAVVPVGGVVDGVRAGGAHQRGARRAVAMGQFADRLTLESVEWPPGGTADYRSRLARVHAEVGADGDSPRPSIHESDVATVDGLPVDRVTTHLIELDTGEPVGRVDHYLAWDRERVASSMTSGADPQLAFSRLGELLRLAPHGSWDTVERLVPACSNPEADRWHVDAERETYRAGGSPLSDS